MTKPLLSAALSGLLLTSCAALVPPPATSTIYTATYDIQLTKVERPEKASKRYGPQKIDTISNDAKYKAAFEDKLVRVLWIVTSSDIAFSLTNKTDHSIKIPWDEAAYVDEMGQSHRVMHAGIKYNEREQPMPPSVVVRGGHIEDIVFPTDYVSWFEGGRYVKSKWTKKDLLPNSDYHSNYSKGQYASFEQFDAAMQTNVGKTLQVLLPLQIEGVVNDYIFSFTVKSVASQQKTL